jgi:DNA modification methylase
VTAEPMSDFAPAARALLLVGDVRRGLAELAAGSVQMVATSPPYWGLRSYGTEPQVWGGEPEHEHAFGRERIVGGGLGHVTYGDSRVRWQNPVRKGEAAMSTGAVSQGSLCECGAWLGELGNEPTPELYVEHIREVFRHVWRVLRDDGTVWLNIGDSYAGSGKGPNTGNSLANGRGDPRPQQIRQGFVGQKMVPQGTKPKDLLGMPWRVALALQADGWYWRSTICWAKKAPMPESVRDRPTSAWEPILLLTKSERYFYDAAAVMEERSQNTHARRANGLVSLAGKQGRRSDGVKANPSFHSATGEVLPTRNQRNVWLLGPEPFAAAHFATFVTEVPRRCILAGTSERGCCPECGAPWERVSQVDRAEPQGAHDQFGRRGEGRANHHGQGDASIRRIVASTTTGWAPTCEHTALAPVPCVVLDPFAGAGTTLMMAARLGRASIGIELKPEYAQMAADRIRADAGFTVDVELRGVG